MPQQIELNLDEADEVHPRPTIPPEREPQLIALMAQAIVAAWQREQEAEHDAR
jgi:hypothetical protein